MVAGIHIGIVLKMLLNVIILIVHNIALYIRRHVAIWLLIILLTQVVPKAK